MYILYSTGYFGQIEIFSTSTNTIQILIAYSCLYYIKSSMCHPVWINKQKWFQKSFKKSKEQLQNEAKWILDLKSKLRILGYKISLSDFSKLLFSTLVEYRYQNLNKIPKDIWYVCQYLFSFFLNWLYTSINIVFPLKKATTVDALLST